MIFILSLLGLAPIFQGQKRLDAVVECSFKGVCFLIFIGFLAGLTLMYFGRPDLIEMVQGGGG